MSFASSGAAASDEHPAPLMDPEPRLVLVHGAHDPSAPEEPEPVQLRAEGAGARPAACRASRQADLRAGH